LRVAKLRNTDIIYEELPTLICATLCFVDNLWEKGPKNQLKSTRFADPRGPQSPRAIDGNNTL